MAEIPRSNLKLKTCVASRKCDALVGRHKKVGNGWCLFGLMMILH